MSDNYKVRCHKTQNQKVYDHFDTFTLNQKRYCYEINWCYEKKTFW